MTLSFALVAIGLLLRSLPGSVGFLPSSKNKISSTRILTTYGNINDGEDHLFEIAKRLKLEIFDLDEGIYGLESKDSSYGLKVVQTQVKVDGGLGLVLTEMAGNKDGRGLVLISEVSGNGAQASPAIQVGDIVTGIRTTDGSYQGGTTGLNYDGTVETIAEAKLAATDGVLHLQLNRMVQRAKMTVEIEDEKGHVTTLETLAGENLRRLLQRKGVQIYDDRTKRFDMPFATGDCAGEGLCGTCLVAVKVGMDILSPKDDSEALITKGRPVSWRASCRTVIGPKNKPGILRIAVKPQSQFSDELNPGVRSVNQE